MCGVAGIVSAKSNADGLVRALEAIRHRGPDAGAVEVFECNGKRVQFGHRRLSIVDLTDAANQPLTSTCGNFTVIFNGEIYNHVELRQQLAARGYAFKTRSDTEVLLAGFSIEGPDFVSRLNGMFALAMLDRGNGRLVCARDSVGIKPLYYRRSKASFAFASEIRGLVELCDEPIEADPGCFAEFLLNGFLYEPSTGFANVAKIPPSHLLTLDIASLAVSLRPFEARPESNPGYSSFGTACRKQVGLEMLADVPVGVFFSGGLDSSTLVAAAPRDAQALFVDYGADSEGDRRYARAVAEELGVAFRQTTHAVGDLSGEDILDEFRQVARGTEEPTSDYTFVATRILSRLAREAGFKVMLSGMGGDELFAGYPRHNAARHWPILRRGRVPLSFTSRLLGRLPSWSKRAGRLESFLNASDFAAAYTSLVGYFSSAEVAQMLHSQERVDTALDGIRALLEPVRGESTLRQALHLDRYGFLAHNLTVTDRASMAESIEVRVPLLAPSLQRISAALPDDALLARGKGKLPLRNFLYGRLPHNLVNRPKVGFNPPLDRRIERLGRPLCEELLTSGPITSAVEPQFLRRLLSDHFERGANNTYRIWQLIYFKLWLEEHANRGLRTQ
jgi:asparagine synthase (glutamine-hydrolysing)